MSSGTDEPVVDVLGEPYRAETIDLPADDEGVVVATLVSRPADGEATRGAILHVHGFSDYFFQTVAADFWCARGYAFYALDLRKYGRSLRPHQSPNFAADLREYDAELHEAWRRITLRDGHERVVVSAHSTGGLVLSLWLDRARPQGLAGVFLNSPWLEFTGSPPYRLAVTTALEVVAARRPKAVLPRSVPDTYARSLHASLDGEWDFDLDWKPRESQPVFAGWVRAVRRGQAALHRGLSIPVPVLVLTSTGTVFLHDWDETVHEHDVVLDVEAIRRWAHCLGDHVSVVRVPGARHDVTLSRDVPRARVFAELGTWLGAYVEGD